jgi:hypothetical protein
MFMVIKETKKYNVHDDVLFGFSMIQIVTLPIASTIMLMSKKLKSCDCAEFLK